MKQMKSLQLFTDMRTREKNRIFIRIGLEESFHRNWGGRVRFRRGGCSHQWSASQVRMRKQGREQAQVVSFTGKYGQRMY